MDIIDKAFADFFAWYEANDRRIPEILTLIVALAVPLWVTYANWGANYAPTGL